MSGIDQLTALFDDMSMEKRHFVDSNDFKPPPSLATELRPFETSETEESACLLSEVNVSLASHAVRGLTSGLPPSASPAYVVDRYSAVYKTKPSDKFEVFPRAERYISEASENTFKCPVCFKKKTNFFCPNCIRNGDFTHSKTNFLERFADKKLKFIRLKGQQMQMSNRVQQHFHNSALKDDLNLQIRETEKNLAILKRVIMEKKNWLKDLNSALNDTKRKTLKCQQKNLHLSHRIAEVKNLVARQSVSLNDQHRNKEVHDNVVQILLRQKLATLTTYIYPFSEENVSGLEDSVDRYDLSLSADNESAPLLSFASDTSPNTSLVKRENTKATAPLIRYRLVDPWIASNENFNLFFAQSNRMEYHELRENNFRNDEYRITAALSYLCHLTNLIAIFCDIHLPKRLLFSEFYFKEFKKEDFLSKIAKLNTNILFLCIYHRIDPAMLHPKQSFKNLQLVLNCPNFIGILDNFTDISNQFYKTMQDNLITDLSLAEKEDQCFDQSSEPHDEHDYDFVDQSNIPDLDFSEFPSNDQSTTAGNLLSLVSSFYKRTTGQR